jgi:disulfide bond formation protein DsbB
MRLSLRACFGLLALAAIGLTLAGWWIGEWMRLQPCPLCIFQRLLYLLIALLALAGMLLPAWSRLWGLLLGSDGSRRAGNCGLPELAAVSARYEHGVRSW